MILLAVILAMLFSLSFGYAVGRVHGINQSVKALDKYGKTLALVDGKDPGELPYKTLLPAKKGRKEKREKTKNVHYGCGGQWDKWVDCTVNIVNSDGSRTGNKVLGQRRNCGECGVKEVRTDI